MNKMPPAPVEGEELMLEVLSDDDEDYPDDDDFEIDDDSDVELVKITTLEPSDENKKTVCVLSLYVIIIEPILPMTLLKLPISSHLIQSLLPILNMQIIKILRTV